MITFDEFGNKLKSVEHTIIDALPTIIDEKALNTIALLKNRFIQQGLIADESGNETSFPAYSTAYQKKKDKKSAGTPNRLVLTGDMLRKLKITDRKTQGSVYSVVIGGGDKFAEDKLEYNSDHYGNVLNLSKTEIELIEKSATEDLLQILNGAIS